MRKSLIAMLMLATAAPAMAQSANDDAGARDRAANEMARARQSERVERQQQRSAPPANWNRAQRAPARSVAPDAGMRDLEANRIARQRQQSVQQPYQQRIDPRVYHRRGTGTQPGLTREQWSQLPADAGARDRIANQLSRQYPGIDLSRPADARRWRDDWRRDSRYDWRRYRSSNWSIFSGGMYYDPFGYSYRRYGYGYRMYPAYYSSRYWISDPFMYRLPPVYGPYRWVRYWDDAMLVDIRTGMVVDVIRDFFW